MLLSRKTKKVNTNPPLAALLECEFVPAGPKGRHIPYRFNSSRRTFVAQFTLSGSLSHDLTIVVIS
jgi:hypothetical protein